MTCGLKLLPQVSNWYTPPWGTVHAYHTEAPPGPGSPVSVVAFTLVPATVPELLEIPWALAKLSLAGASDALGVTGSASRPMRGFGGVGPVQGAGGLVVLLEAGGDTSSKKAASSAASSPSACES